MLHEISTMINYTKVYSSCHKRNSKSMEHIYEYNYIYNHVWVIFIQTDKPNQ